MPRSIEGLLAFFELWVGSPYKVPSATWDHAQDEIGVMIRRGDDPDREKTALHGQWDQKQSRSVAIIIIATAMPLRGGSRATATTITGLTFALTGGGTAPRGITAAWPITVSIEGGQQDPVRKDATRARSET